MYRLSLPLLVFAVLLFGGAATAQASLSLTAGSNATTTPNVATSITGFQIVGPSASTTPVKLRATSGTLSLSSVSGVTMTGNNSSTVNLSGTVANLNTALATLTYSRGSTGTDTLEVSLVEAGEVFFDDNGHLYKYISDAGTWNAAKTKAEALTLYGAAGYLATITSSAENDFVTARLSNAGWMGASDAAVEGAWRWVTGPENGTQFWSGLSGGSTVNGNYANWGTGEPNDSGGEDCGQYLSGGSGKWNDLPCGSTSLPGYVAEFGAPDALPTVVAQNISIVTADVPAIVSLSPANAATNVSTTTNLTLTFTKSVTVGTGSVSIYKASDDSLFEAIDVTGGNVSDGGVSFITLNPAGTLAEGTQYYVTVPSTAFKDSSNNFFGGFTDETTWTFTTADTTAPVISSLSADAATTTVAVTWSTNESASTRLWYSADTRYASSTVEANTSPRVTSHSVSLSNLVACTLYHYRAVSRDAAGNTATSTAESFLTDGCSGGATPSTSTSTQVTVASTATTTLTDTERTLSVETPANFTATSSSVVIQIKGLPRDTVLGTIGKPIDSLSGVAPIVFDVTALIDNQTVLDSFDIPVTVSYTYKDEDIAGLDESSLVMYHYRDSAWSALDSCSVSTGTNTITCEAPHFSIFAIFGSASVSSGSAPARSGTSIQARVKNLYDLGMNARAEELKAEWHWLFPQTANAAPAAAPATSIPVRDLELGTEGEDVLRLQKLLNATGFTLASAGVGAPGNETTYFGSLTKTALAAYQAGSNVSPAVGYFGPLTRASMSAKGLAGLWW